VITPRALLPRPRDEIVLALLIERNQGKNLPEYRSPFNMSPSALTG